MGIVGHFRISQASMVWAWLSWNTKRYSGLGMDALLTVCSWNTNVVLVWPRMLW